MTRTAWRFIGNSDTHIIAASVFSMGEVSGSLDAIVTIHTDFGGIYQLRHYLSFKQSARRLVVPSGLAVLMLGIFLIPGSGVIVGKGSMPPAGRNPSKRSRCAGSGRIEIGSAFRRNASTGFKFRLPQLGFLERPDGGHHLVEVWVGAFRFLNSGDGFFEHYAGVRDPVAFGEALEIKF